MPKCVMNVIKIHDTRNECFIYDGGSPKIYENACIFICFWRAFFAPQRNFAKQNGRKIYVFASKYIYFFSPVIVIFVVVKDFTI